MDFDKINKAMGNGNLLDLLLDQDNTTPIVMCLGNKVIAFEQVAVIPLDDVLYCILTPVEPLEGVAEDEAIVFRVDVDEKGEATLEVESDKDTAVAVFDRYYEMLDEEGE